MMMKKHSKNNDLGTPLDITVKKSYNKVYLMMMFNNNNNEVKI
jgi:hypothetical protein